MNSESETLTRIKNILLSHPKGMTTEDIAKSLPLNRTSTAKYLNTLLISGQIEQQVVGRARLFKCCKRIPMSQLLSFYSEAVIVMDHERVIREINPQFFESFDVKQKDVIGKKFDTVSSGTNITHILMPGICRAIDGQISTNDHPIQYRDQTVLFRSKYIPVVFDQGPPGAAVLLEKVTARNTREIPDQGIPPGGQAVPGASTVIPGPTGTDAGAGSPYRILDGMPDLVMEIDTSLHPHYVSPSHLDILGYRPDELMGSSYFDLIHPDDQDLLGSEITKMIRENTATRKEYRIRHKDGRELWLETVAKPLLDHEARCKGGILSSRDISDRISGTYALQQNCLALQDTVNSLMAKVPGPEQNASGLSPKGTLPDNNGELLHALFEQVYDPLVLIRVNTDGTLGAVVDANEAASRLFGYSREEFMEQPAGNILLHSPLSPLSPASTEGARTDLRGWYHATFTRQGGTTNSLDASVRIVPSGTGAVALVIFREGDITGRTQDDTIHREAGELFTINDIINYLPEATFVIDTEGVVLAWNKAMEEMTGTPAYRIVGKGDFTYALSFYHEKRPILIDFVLKGDPEITTFYPSVQKSGRYWHGEIFIQDQQNGRGAFFLLSATRILDRDGNCIGAIESIRDITSYKNNENELRLANQQLSLLTEFTRHDVLARVNSALGHLNLSGKTGSDPGIAALLGTLKTNLEEIKLEIEFPRQYQTLNTLEPEWLDLSLLLSHLDIPPHITFRSTLEEIEIFADPVFRQVFPTFLENGRRHGGKVTGISVSSQETPFGLTVSWEDNGVGIPNNQKESIFRRGGGKSTGLGLFLIREILGITGIKIRETGIEGNGARFEIIVPKGAYRRNLKAVGAEKTRNATTP